MSDLPFCQKWQIGQKGISAYNRRTVTSGRLPTCGCFPLSFSTMSTNPENPSPALTAGQAFNPWRGVCGFYPPDAVNRQKNLTDGQKLVYARLVRYAGRDGHCYPSFRRLADDLGKSERQVKRDILALEEEHRLIRHVRRGRRLSNLYQFYWHPMFDGDVTPVSPHSQGEVTPTALHKVGSEVPDLPGEVTSVALGEVTPMSPESCTEETCTKESSRESPCGTEEPVAPFSGAYRAKVLKAFVETLQDYPRPPARVPLVNPMALCEKTLDEVAPGTSWKDIGEFIRKLGTIDKIRPDSYGFFYTAIKNEFGPKTTGRAPAGVPGAARAAPARMLARCARGVTTGEFRKAASQGG